MQRERRREGKWGEKECRGEREGEGKWGEGECRGRGRDGKIKQFQQHCHEHAYLLLRNW